MSCALDASGDSVAQRCSRRCLETYPGAMALLSVASGRKAKEP
jgi:hypothetical protein